MTKKNKIKLIPCETHCRACIKNHGPPPLSLAQSAHTRVWNQFNYPLFSLVHSLPLPCAVHRCRKWGSHTTSSSYALHWSFYVARESVVVLRSHRMVSQTLLKCKTFVDSEKDKENETRSWENVEGGARARVFGTTIRHTGCVQTILHTFFGLSFSFTEQRTHSKNTHTAIEYTFGMELLVNSCAMQRNETNVEWIFLCIDRLITNDSDGFE